MSIEQQSIPLPLEVRLQAVFGRDGDPMPLLEERAAELVPEYDAIVWEAGAAPFRFTYASAAAERVLGYPRARWTAEPAFWAEVVVHAADREAARSFRAEQTRAGRDHEFSYRASTADGRVIRLRDLARVLRAPDGTPARVRGIMIPVP